MLRLKLLIGCLVISLAHQVSYAQQDDDVLLIDVASRLTSGRPNFDGTWSLGVRSYQGRFESDFTTRDPGWNTLGSGSPAMPVGAVAPPANTDLEWDFLPVKVDGTVSTLLYWNGMGPVTFGQTPAEGYELFLQSKSSGFIGADGSAELITGAVIDDTDSIGSIHRHRFWFLDDGDGQLETDPADGVYLVSIHTRMQELDRSRPLFFVFGTLNTSSSALNDAQNWVDSVIEDLAPDFAADFDGDLDVDAEDLQTWMLGYGRVGNSALQVSGDANFDQSVDGADFLAWQRQLGSDMSTFVGAPLMAFSATSFSATESIPEPNGLITIVGGCLWLLSARHKQV